MITIFHIGSYKENGAASSELCFFGSNNSFKKFCILLNKSDQIFSKQNGNYPQQQ
jgi:hypothetical protein